MNKTAVIYARVSSTRQADDGLPIASQIEQAELKAEQLGAQVLKVFKDEGISGRSAEKRPAFQDAIAFCAAFDVEYFICWSTSRFARNKIDAASYKKLLADGNTKLVYITTDIDEDTDEGWFTGSLLEIVDEHYSRVVSRDTRRSMMKNARDGFFNGGRVPFGYTPKAEGKRRRLQINELEAQTIRDIFNLCLVGMGSKAIAMKLNETGQLKNGKKWDKNTVSLVLKNPVYAGLTVFNRTNNAGNNRPVDEWIITPSHAGIITQDLFDNAQILIGQRAPAAEGGSPHSNFVFTGILRCGDCGAAMQVESATGRNKTYHYYNCRSALKGIGCENRRIPAHELDDYLSETILNGILTPRRVSEAVKEIHTLTSEWNETISRRRSAQLAEVKKLQGRRTKLFEILELYGKDAPNLGDITVRLRELNDDIKQAELGLTEINDYTSTDFDLKETEILRASALMREIIEKCTDPKKKRTFYSQILDRIIIRHDGWIDIEYQPLKIINRPIKEAVHSTANWLLDLGSNQGHTD
ncbi:recombinase family protein [Deefgea piscis]|uniref:recombinase family protein n=1 Tax=Deefgea piscis TaxID=2739061 RepID=UPI0035B5697B